MDRKPKMSNFGIFKGADLLTREFGKRPWIIEGLLKERDAILWVGQEKSGKTLLSFQAFLCNLTSGTPFLDRHNVPKKRKVTYILLEGDLAESQDRLLRLQKQLEIHAENFVFMFLPRLMLHKEDGQYGLQHVINEIKKHDCHEIVVIDPLYRAFCGSLNNDEVVREVCVNFDKMKDALECALVIIHHTHKKKFDIKGNQIAEGDDAVFGSVWFKAWASQIILQTFDSKTGDRAFFCNTQRSGDIIKECNLKLIQPDPLYFTEDKTPEVFEKNHSLSIINLLRETDGEGLSKDQIEEKLTIKDNEFYKSIKLSLSQGVIAKHGSKRPVRYYYVR